MVKHGLGARRVQLTVTPRDPRVPAETLTCRLMSAPFLSLLPDARRAPLRQRPRSLMAARAPPRLRSAIAARISRILCSPARPHDSREREIERC